MHTIEAAAKKLAEDKIMVDMYEEVDANNQQWFFTKNKSLGGAHPKPPNIPNDEKGFDRWWRELHPAQSQTIYTLANFWWTTYKKVNHDEFKSIKSAYDKWPDGYYSVFYGSKLYSCNLFVGEALFTYGRKIMKHGKYYSAHEIWEAFSPFKLVKKENVKAGNIVAMFGHHVEIVTSVDVKAGTFCSRGAGRRYNDGIEKCEVDGRKIHDKEIKFLSI